MREHGRMAGVVNHLRFKEAVDPQLFARAERDLTSQMGAIGGCQGFHVIQTSDTELVLVILGDDVDVLNRLAREVGSPWMTANVAPLLAGPPDRHIVPTIASSQAR